jgi:hypothetical protein
MGLARNLERHGERDLTQSGVTLGTFDYISPEQALEPREADSRSDIYSLGCTLYHMLTGQPPVPEGTPAKKLQHHQQHEPIDPRRFNPEIPDEIVRILSKMMAKDPRDRYQRPIHLVQHLMPAARKVGAVNDMPEGQLLIDAPLPGQPRSRPMLMIGLALAALAAVTLLFSFASSPNQPVNLPSTITDSKLVPVVPDPDRPSLLIPPRPPTPPALMVVSRLEDIDSVLKGNMAAEIKIKIGESLTLGSTGIVFEGKSEQRLLFEPEDSETRTIRFDYKKNGAPFGITLDGGREVVFRRIKFVIDSESTPLRPAAAIAVRGVGTVRFEECLFIQNVQKIMPNKVPIASVLIEALPNGELVKPSVQFDKCYFDGNLQNGGQVAVAVNGAASVRAANCAFRPHGAFFSFRDKCSKEDTSLDLRNCAGFVEVGPAFRFSAKASAAVDVQNSAFARPESEISDRPEVSPGLIYLTGDRPIQYNGRHNLYYNLNSLIQQKDKLFTNKADEFQNYLALHGAADKDSFFLDKAANPLQHSNPLGQIEKLSAFQLIAKYHAEGIGLRNSWAGEMLAPPTPIVQVKTSKKIVDSDARRQPGEFSTIAAALSDAQDGDVLFIKHAGSREVVVRPASLRSGISVTIKPYDGFRPILVLDKAIEKKESAFFEVQKKGKLHLENLEFLLDPEAGYDRRSVVQMGEAVHIVLEKCVFSLKGTNRVELSVATFLDLDKTMKMETSSPLPAKVEFHECFVRGKGDLVALQGCRKLDVLVTNSLIALDGSLLDVDASSKAMAMSQGVQWKMDRSSIFTTEPLFALHAKTGTMLTETNAKIKDCLLAALALNGDQDVVWLDTSREAKLGAYLKWDGEHNFYANFDKDKLREWKDKIPEVITDFGKLTFSPKLGEDAKRPPLWEATPDLFKPIEADQERLNGFGLPPESEKRLLPASPPVPDEP